MRRCLCLLLTLTLLALILGCGTGYNNPTTNVGLYGNWNVTMYPTGSATPVYVFGLAMSQEGSSNYSGASIVYNGSVAAPSNMCINASTLTAVASTSGNNFTMTVTDATSGTVISVTGSLASQTSELTGNYSNVASSTCPSSSGTVDMLAQ